MSHFWEKRQTDGWTYSWKDGWAGGWTDRQMDRKTDNSDYIGTSIGPGQKSQLYNRVF